MDTEQQQQQQQTQDASLSQSFARAQRQLRSLESTTLASNSKEYQKQVQDLVALLKSCSSQADSLSLFSSNETADDYSTSELHIILIYAYLGEALQKLNAPDGGRSAVLQEAMQSYKTFLTNCQAISIISQSKDLDRVLNRSKKDSSDKQPPAVDPGMARLQKIERFKKVRSMQREVADLEALLGKDSDSDNEDMDEVEREYAVKLIELKIHQVIDDIDMLESELEMAIQMDAMRLKARESAPGDREKPGSAASAKESANDWRLDSQSYNQIDPRTGRPVQPLFNSRGQPMRPFVLTNERQRIKDSVFRPDWALPTMTIDEYLKQEQENGNIISGGGKEPDEKPEIDDNDHDALDADTLKKREWDDFKDDNPKGMGNRGGNRG
ncbi:Type 2A phosphatase-associated protein 42 [Coemansia sp. Benny D115]|nr:Type 2A phosphatase-associated protein 42 [Coemansia sp. Benny D115]